MEISDFQPGQPGRKPWKALLLSILFPGLGHVYAGATRRGLAMVIAGEVGITLFAMVLFSFPVFVVFVVAANLWYLWIVADAYRQCRKNPSPLRPQWLFYPAFVMGCTAGYLLVLVPLREQFSSLAVAKLPASNMLPTVASGDIFVWQKTQAIERGDLVVYRESDKNPTPFVSRCVGQPGDTLAVREGLVYLNGMLKDDPDHRLHAFFVKINAPSVAERQFKALGVLEYIPVYQQVYSVSGTAAQEKALAQWRWTNPQSPIESGAYLFPEHHYKGWTQRNYGPVYLPRKGDSIHNGPEALAYWQKLIPNLQQTRSQHLLPEMVGTLYGAASERFFFVMGDNRDNSKDSRFTGPVPEHLIEGKALFCVWSRDWDKIGKTYRH